MSLELVSDSEKAKLNDQSVRELINMRITQFNGLEWPNLGLHSLTVNHAELAHSRTYRNSSLRPIQKDYKYLNHRKKDKDFIYLINFSAGK